MITEASIPVLSQPAQGPGGADASVQGQGQENTKSRLQAVRREPSFSWVGRPFCSPGASTGRARPTAREGGRLPSVPCLRCRAPPGTPRDSPGIVLTTPGPLWPRRAGETAHRGTLARPR